jgi:hypothetical protein
MIESDAAAQEPNPEPEYVAAIYDAIDTWNAVHA